MTYRIDRNENGRFAVVYNLDLGYWGRRAAGPFKTYQAALAWAEANIA